jgi:hypothetical protein
MRGSMPGNQIAGLGGPDEAVRIPDYASCNTQKQQRKCRDPAGLRCDKNERREMPDRIFIEGKGEVRNRTTHRLEFRPRPSRPALY